MAPEREPIVAFLRAKGAERIPHPGGTLFAHLTRVAATVASWQEHPSLVSAALCHAAFGTVGFPVPLIGVDQRAELASLLGSEAEAIVYVYCSDDRAHGLSGTATVTTLRDRFAGTDFTPSEAMRRHLATLSVANELDVLAHLEPSREERETFLSLLSACHPLLGPEATVALDRVLDLHGPSRGV